MPELDAVNRIAIEDIVGKLAWARIEEEFGR